MCKGSGVMKPDVYTSYTHCFGIDMNKIINHWDKYVSGGTSFKNKGAVFIQASKETGLDPVYILAHAAWESSWGNSSLAKNKHNYFGIAAYDHDPYNSAYVMGDTIADLTGITSADVQKIIEDGGGNIKNILSGNSEYIKNIVY